MTSVAYVIENTSGAVTFHITPGGIDSSTSLTFPGFHRNLWGEYINENIYHLMENFACPQKALAPIRPQDATDLGAGRGVNNPVAGQTWWNTTNGKLYVYTGTVWDQLASNINANNPPNMTVGGVTPSGPNTGDLWYDTSVPLLKVYSGAWIDVGYVKRGGDTMTGNLTISRSGANGSVLTLNPTAGQDAAIEIGNLSPNAYIDFHTTVTSAADFNARIIVTGANMAISSGGQFNVSAGTTATIAASGGRATLQGVPAGADPFGAHVFGGTGHVGITAGTNKLWIFQNDGNLAVPGGIIYNLAEPSAANHAATKNYVDTHGLGGNTYVSTGGLDNGVWYQNTTGRHIIVYWEFYHSYQVPHGRRITNADPIFIYTNNTNSTAGAHSKRLCINLQSSPSDGSPVWGLNEWIMGYTQHVPPNLWFMVDCPFENPSNSFLFNQVNGFFFHD